MPILPITCVCENVEYGDKPDTKEINISVFPDFSDKFPTTFHFSPTSVLRLRQFSLTGFQYIKSSFFTNSTKLTMLALVFSFLLDHYGKCYQDLKLTPVNAPMS